MSVTLTAAQAKSMLLALGFDNANRSFVAATKGFQRGWNLGNALDDDGDVGPLTSDALAVSYARLRQGKPTMSAHFSFTEFRCNDGGAFPECQRIWTLRAHVRRLEVYRNQIGGPVRVVSGCRCLRHNTAVGGATSSQHLFGAASDIQGLVDLQAKIDARLFAGLGFQSSTNKVVHVDSRDVSGHNTTGGSPANPTQWKYAT